MCCVRAVCKCVDPDGERGSREDLVVTPLATVLTLPCVDVVGTGEIWPLLAACLQPPHPALRFPWVGLGQTTATIDYLPPAIDMGAAGQVLAVTNNHRLSTYCHRVWANPQSVDDWRLSVVGLVLSVIDQMPAVDALPSGNAKLSSVGDQLPAVCNYIHDLKDPNKCSHDSNVRAQQHADPQIARPMGEGGGEGPEPRTSPLFPTDSLDRTAAGTSMARRLASRGPHHSPNGGGGGGGVPILPDGNPSTAVGRLPEAVDCEPTGGLCPENNT